MGAISRLNESARGLVRWRNERSRLNLTIEHLNESMSSAVAALRKEDAGWSQLSTIGQGKEFTYEQRLENARAARFFSISNPLAIQGLAIRSAYVWGTGLGVTASDEDVNTVVQGFLDDARNRSSFAGHQARLNLERALSTDGNVYLACFTSPRTGDVQVRQVEFEQITEVISNPDDASEPWYYRRKWAVNGVTHEQLHPALGYRPAAVRPRRISGVEVRWDAPLYHVKDGGNAGWEYGVGDLYAAVFWIRAYTGFLTDWSKLTKSISTIAYRISGKKNSDVMAARRAASDALSSGTVGGAIAATGVEIQSMPSTGATIDANSGNPLARMIAAALGLPITQLLGDPGSTGARAVAETLTKPMVLRFQNRRELWAEAYRAILNHVIDAHIAAPGGSLSGTVKRVGDRLKWSLAGDSVRTLVFDWPEIEEITLADILAAVEKLDATGLAPKDTLARLGLRALKVRDVDEIIDSMRDGEGNFIPAGASVSDALLTSYQDGLA